MGRVESNESIAREWIGGLTTGECRQCHHDMGAHVTRSNDLGIASLDCSLCACRIYQSSEPL